MTDVILQPCAPGCRASHTVLFWARVLKVHPKTIKRWMREKRPGKPRLEFERNGPKVVVISHEQMNGFRGQCKVLGGTPTHLPRRPSAAPSPTE